MASSSMSYVTALDRRFYAIALFRTFLCNALRQKYFAMGTYYLIVTGINAYAMALSRVLM